jgi:hypothetical protein
MYHSSFGHWRSARAHMESLHVLERLLVFHTNFVDQLGVNNDALL